MKVKDVFFIILRTISTFLTVSDYFIISFLIFTPLSLKAQEDSLTLPLSRGGGVFHTELNTGYYYTESNYTQRFTSQALRQVLGLKSDSPSPFFQYMNMELSLGYSLTNWFEVEVFSSGFWFAQSGNGENLRFSGPQIKRAGLAFRSQQSIIKAFGFIPEFSFSFPFFAIKTHTEKPITDDGSLHFTPSLWIYGAIGEVFYPFIYGGLKIRTLALSSLLQWKAGVMLKSNIAEIGFYSYGFWSVIRDKSSAVLGDRANLLKRTNAGSLRFFSANPGLIGFTGWLGWHFPYVTLRLSGDMDINGTNYSRGYTFLASVIIALGGHKKKKMDEIFTEPTEHFEPQMIEEVESVNDIFENPMEDARIQHAAEQALEAGEQTEEEKIEETTTTEDPANPNPEE
ncbi:MAG: hypothetical protein OXM55_08300 [Bdellovibrionales bacterium]|nr:hypothetical protein [Bdellovibrionales bacterium]